MHLGHSLFLTIQDSIHRWNKINEHQSLMFYGLDHAGIATHEKIIEHSDLNNISYEEAAFYIENQNKNIILNQFKSMYVLADDRIVNYTMNQHYQQFSLSILNLLYEDNKIYKKDNDLYIDIKAEAKELANDIRNNTIKIIPEKEIGSLLHFLDNIQDWCISRNIKWGLPIPKNIINYFFKTNQDLVLDTWFNSSLYPLSSLLYAEKELNIKNIEKFYPAQLIETGYDILFFWCSRMLMMGNYICKNQHRLNKNILSFKIQNKYPFYTIYLHGLIRDKFNRKFSKSLGNGINPLELIEEYCVDAIRLYLITKTSAGEDIKFNKQEISSYNKFINKVYNAAKFFAMYSENNEIIFDPNKLDNHTKNVLGKYENYMNNYNFINAARLIQHEFKDYFCDVFIEQNKCDIKNKNANMDIMLNHLYAYLLMLNPFCPQITETIII